MTLEKWEIPIPEGARLGPPVPAGTYRARVTEPPEIVTSSKGTRQMRFPVVVTQGEHEGKTIDVYRPIGAPRAWGRLLRTLDSLGVKYEADPVTRRLKLDPLDFPGKECRIVVEERPWQGRKRVRVTDILPIEVEIEAGVEEVPSSSEPEGLVEEEY